MSDINVTPMVDIMLVLLIIFMVTAPLMTQGVEVDLPKESAQPISTDTEPLVISVRADGKVYIEDKQIDMATLGEKVRGIRDANPKLPVYVRGDRAVDYGAVVKVMASLAKSGVDRIGLITEVPDT
ncbi:MAG: protein TolR [Magnetococcales bacterium]|nr:protein TolR [Magnetococcales bacterium]